MNRRRFFAIRPIISTLKMGLVIHETICYNAVRNHKEVGIWN